MFRQDELMDAFVELADTLVAEFDLVEFLHLLARRCVELLDADAAGLMLTDQRGQLRLMASSAEESRMLELFELEADEGPCVACFHRGEPVTHKDLAVQDPRWTKFGHRAHEAGFRAVHAVPMRLRTDTIGVLNLFYGSPGALGADDARLARALADVATIGLLQQRAIRQQQALAEHLQAALHERVVVEQAKGVLAERLHISTDTAFDALRHHSRSYDYQLTELAYQVVTSTEPVDIAWPINNPPAPPTVPDGPA